MGSIMQEFSDWISPPPTVMPPALSASNYKPMFTQEDQRYYDKMMAERDEKKIYPPYQPEFTKGENIPAKTRTAKDIVLPMIRDWETFQPKVYDDGYGNPTIGYGMRYLPNGKEVTWNTPDLTKEQAEEMLNQKIDAFTSRLQKFPTFNALKPHQQAALLDLAFTTGPNIDEKKDKNGKLVFPTLSAILKDPTRADELAKMIPQIRRANGEVSQGLVNRRKDTSEMFSKEDYEYQTKAERAKKIAPKDDTNNPDFGRKKVEGKYDPTLDQDFFDKNGNFSLELMDKWFEDDSREPTELQRTTWTDTPDEMDKIEWKHLNSVLPKGFYPAGESAKKVGFKDMAGTYDDFHRQGIGGYYKDEKDMIQKNLHILRTQFEELKNDPSWKNPNDDAFGPQWYQEPKYGE